MPKIFITGRPEIDRLLEKDPLALVIGMLLDQQVPMEWAFRGPFTLKERLGSLDAAEIAAMPVESLEATFKEKPALHRYPASMARRTHELCRHVVEHYGGDGEEDLEGDERPCSRLSAHLCPAGIWYRQSADILGDGWQTAQRRSTGMGAICRAVRWRGLRLCSRH